jgi:drug/metabolite transporter (DMT)-like permease
MIGRRLRAHLSLTAYIFIVYSSAAVVLLIITALSQQPFSGFPAIAYVWFFLLALIPQMIGHSSFNYALGYLPAAYVSVMLLGEPIGSTILAILLLNEIPTPFKIIGGIFILLGIYLVSREQNSQ